MKEQVFKWQPLVQRALAIESTPFYLCAWEPIEQAYAELGRIPAPVPVKHWLSFKTHPAAPLVRQWNRLGRGVEVVSEFEVAAVLAEGFPPDRILVNGVLKHSWLPKVAVPGLRVHFDSVAEVQCLAPLAAQNRWAIGLRLHVHQAFDPDEPDYPCQFGMTVHEAEVAVKTLRDHSLPIRSVHFHLRSNICDVGHYSEAVRELAAACRTVGIAPEVLDIGGGFPTPGSRMPGGSGTYPDMSKLLESTLELATCELPGITEIWMENGRFLTGRSAALVVSVLDDKWRGRTRFLICDGGRTNHALVSDWEEHSILSVPERNGRLCWTTAAGPTCMAFDRLARTWLPEDVQVGDVLVWSDAGAYHLPWETRFSHGHAPVLWCDDEGLITQVRARQPFADWWGCWRPSL